jgi:hypothetical protein
VGRLVPLVLVAFILAGCGSQSFDWRKVEVHGDQLWLPDGTTITVRVAGELPPACDPNAPDVDCLHVSTTHGCDLQTSRVVEEFEGMTLGPPEKDDQHALVLSVPVAPDACEG